MKKLSKEKSKGITLIALVITIIVLLILAGVSIATLTGDNGILRRTSEARNATESGEQRDKDAISNFESLINDYGKEIYSESKGINRPQLSEGMIPIKYNGSNWVITNEDDAEWYDYVKGKKEWANIMLSDGKYKTSQSNYSIDGNTVVAEADLGSMFVWIPRFAYSIKEYKVEKNNTEGTTANITDVTFLKGTTLQDKDGNFYETDYQVDQVQVGKPTPKIVHPAFKFGEQNIAGIWVAKFEASMAETNNNTDQENNVTNKTVKILPDAESWRYIQIGNIFTNCLNLKNGSVYELNNTVDSHLMKNNEWGAIVYLAASQYGFVPTRNAVVYPDTENGEVKYHAYTAQGDYKRYIKQSTTGNATGIYDLSGGAWEYVAAYWDNTNSNLSDNGTSNIFPNNILKPEYEKYWDKYGVSQTEITEMNNGLASKGIEANKIRKAIAIDRYNLIKDIKGDAMYEIINTYSYNGRRSQVPEIYIWLIDESSATEQLGKTFYNKNSALIGNISHCFLNRGGNWANEAIFTLRNDSGNPISGNGFRPVLIVE